MASNREILTFQLGNYSNYISTHWWNIQESYFQYDEKKPSEIFHDVLFREGRTFKGAVTFTPRNIVIDKKENTITIPVVSENPNPRKSSVLTWDPKRISIEYSNGPEKHEYIQDLEKIDKGIRISKKDYNFDETVRSWTDYMRTKYHPKSLCLVNNNSQTEIFHSGTDIFNSIQEDLLEKVRSYMEECDNLQGFQVLVDAVDAYGGLANHIILHLRDEYSSKTILTLPVISSRFNNTNPMGDVCKMINILLTYQKLSEYCDLVIPLGTNRTAWRGLGLPISFPHLSYDSSILYQTSAILASFLDTVSLKYRLRNEYCSLNEITSGLNFWNRKICAASMSLPFPMSSTSYLLDTLEGHDESLPIWSCITPGCTIGNERIFYQRITIRGVPMERLRNPSITRRNSQAYTCTSVPEMMHLYLSFYMNTISDVVSARTPLRTDVPYPGIFSRRTSRTGSVEETEVRERNLNVSSCPVLTGLHSCKDIGRMLESLHGSVKSVNIRGLHQYVDEGMDMDEYRECLEKVQIMGGEYTSDTELL